MRLFIILLVGLSSLMSCAQSNKDILRKVSNEISNIKSVKYDSRFNVFDDGQVLFNQMDAIAFEFKSADQSDFKYWLSSEQGDLIYNGKETFQSIVSEKIITTSNDNSPDNINNPLMLTLKPLRQILPQLLEDKDIKISRERDTLIDGAKYFKFSFLLEQKYIDWIAGDIKEGEGDPKYFLFVDQKNHLPFKFITPNGKNGAISRTFENIALDYEFPVGLWKGESLPKDFIVFTEKEYFENRKSNMMDNLGEMVTDWELPLIANDSKINPSKLKGKVVLLEFWFKNCGGCVAAIPSLNSIHAKFKKDNFALFGVEFIDKQSQENLQKYIKEKNIQFPNLYKAKSVAANYGIRGAPTFMILDKSGKIIHLKSGYTEDHIKEMIELIASSL